MGFKLLSWINFRLHEWNMWFMIVAQLIQMIRVIKNEMRNLHEDK